MNKRIKNTQDCRERPPRRCVTSVDPLPPVPAKRHGGRSLQLLAGLLCLLLANNATADWPLVRGDTQATGAVKAKLNGELEELWTYQAEDSGFEATAVIKGGIAYVGDVDGTLHAVDLKTGNAAWTKKFEETGFLAAATIDGEHFYVGDYNGIVRCLSIKDGTEVWKFDTKSEINAAVNVHGEAVLVTTEGGSLFSLQKTDGEKNWEFTIESPLRCWPTVVKDRVLLAGCDGILHAVDVKSGKRVDQVSIEGPTGCTPAVLKEHAYFGTEDGNFFSVELAPLEIAWKYRDPKRPTGLRTAAAVNEKLVIYGSQGKKVYAVDRTSGELAWEFATRTRVECSPLIIGDHVFFGTVRGRLYLVDLKTGEDVWDFNAGGGFIASPAISNGRIIIGNSDGTLYCFGAREK